MSIRWIVTGVAMALTAAAVIAAGWVAERRSREVLTREIETRLLLDARNLALTGSTALLGTYPELTLHPIAREMTEHQPELVLVVVLDPSGTIQGHPDARRLGTPFEPPPELAPLASSAPLQEGESLEADATMIVARVPVRHPDGRPIGTSLVGMRRDYVDGAVTAARREQIIVLAILLACAIGSGILVVSRLLQPVDVLRAGIERIGRGDLETRVALNDRTELGMLAAAINQMTQQLRKGQAEIVERERLAHELELAHQIQASLLPTGPRRAGDFTMEGAQWAAAEVGGDYFDVIELPHGRVGIAIADVAGKGLAGCLVMSMLSTALRSQRDSESPAGVLAAVDEMLSDTLRPRRFVTMFYGVLDPASGRLVFASAGHNPSLVYRQATCAVSRLESRGVPLGCLSRAIVAASLDDQIVDLAAGDALIQYTDGLSESFEPGTERQFGIEGLERTVARAGGSEPGAVIEALRDAAAAWRHQGGRHDDETLLVLRRDPAPRGVRPELEPGDPFRDGEACWEHARANGRGLRLRAGMDSVSRIQPWLGTCPGLRNLGHGEIELLGTILYEVCANIAEHGLSLDPTRCFELWWVASAAPELVGDPGVVALPVREGYFLVRDDGNPFDGARRAPTDFGDPEVRARGRGFGLEIIHRGMQRVVYHPASAAGNITLMRFDPATASRARQEVGNA